MHRPVGFRQHAHASASNFQARFAFASGLRPLRSSSRAMTSFGKRRARAMSTASRPRRSAIVGSAPASISRSSVSISAAAPHKRSASRHALSSQGAVSSSRVRGTPRHRRATPRPTRNSWPLRRASEKLHQRQVLAARNANHTGVARKSSSSSSIGTAASRPAPASSSAVTVLIPWARRDPCRPVSRRRPCAAPGAPSDRWPSQAPERPSASL